MKTAKILYALLAITAAYSLATVLLPEPPVRKYQQQWDENAAKAQRFLFSTNPVQDAATLVGSSLSERLPNYVFDRHFYNLAFSGGSSLTGLELIARSSKHPKFVLIESNIVARKVDSDFLNGIDSPLIQGIPLLREDMKPINFIYSELYSLAFSPRSEYLKQLGKKSDPRIRSIGIDSMLSTQNELVGAEDLKGYLESYDYYVKLFMDSGSQIIFFEMPIDQRLGNTPRAKQIREALKDKFSNLKYIELNSFSDFRTVDTTDGVHLTTSDAVKAGLILCSQVGLDSCTSTLSDPITGH